MVDMRVFTGSVSGEELVFMKGVRTPMRVFLRVDGPVRAAV